MSLALTQSADSIGNTFANDPELQLPEYPRFPAEILVIPYGQSGLLFEGGHGIQVLSGRGARGFIPRLLPLLDGSRDLAALSDEFPRVPVKSLRDAVALLYSRGLLEDGREGEVAPELEAVSAFAGRYVDVTRVNRNRGEVLARLDVVRVQVAGEGPGREALLGALQGQGLGSLTLVEEPTELSKDSDLVLAVFSGDTPEARAQAWMDAARERGLRVLHARLGSDEVEVGPLFVPGKSACYDCLRQLHRAPGGAPRSAGFWAGVLALQAFQLLSRLGRTNLYNLCHVHRNTGADASYREVSLARLPGCATCGLENCAPRLEEEGGEVWLLHNAANGMPPRDLLSPRDYQMHYAPTNLMVTRELPEPYYGAVPVPLPEGRTLDRAPSWLRRSEPEEATGQMDIHTLATLLRISVGYQLQADGSPRRIAPSGGGLGSAEIFVVVRDLPGLEPGVYHYYAHAHRLDRLKGAPAGILAGALGLRERELPPLLLVGVGALGKLRQKYNDFAFRFASLDAGFARVYLYEAMDALGLSVTDYPDARDKVLARALGVPLVGGRNMVTYALGVGTPAERGGRARKPGELNASQHVDTLIELASQRRPPSFAKPQAPTRPQTPARLAGPAPQLERLDRILLERRSQRSFAPRPIAAPLMEDIAALAMGANEWIEASGGLGLNLRLWAAVTASGDGVEPGVYAWSPEDRRWCRRNADLPTEALDTALDSAMLQRSLARAPLILFVTGDFQRTLLDHGARGYREMISRAGCPWGGMSEDGWGELFGIDRYRDCPLFGLSLGYRHAG